MAWINYNRTNNNTQSDLGSTIPLYDQVKKTIFVNFEEMAVSFSNLAVAEKSSEKKLALWDFKKRFINFFIQINHPNKLQLLKEKEQKFLKDCYKGNIKLNKKTANIIIDLSRALIEDLGITAIESKKNNDYDCF